MAFYSVALYGCLVELFSGLKMDIGVRFLPPAPLLVCHALQASLVGWVMTKFMTLSFSTQVHTELLQRFHSFFICQPT